MDFLCSVKRLSEAMLGFEEHDVHRPLVFGKEALGNRSSRKAA